MKACCVVVIGHVDHGKTSLVRALTGIETDRLAEEKSRGLSIVPGFAHYAYDTGIIDFIDAPGHADFIQSMISGATGAAAALVVVSATDGVSAQTLEHLRIAGLLGISKGVVAVTKSDLLAPSDVAERIADIHKALSRTALSDAPLVLCSAQTGDGIDRLHTALAALVPDAPAPTGPLQGVLPIDRVFSIEGRGTIVTGTLLGADLAVEDTALLLPAGQPVTLRGLQSRGEARRRIHAGERMAANLRGVAVEDIPRGAVLASGDLVQPSHCFDVRVSALAGATQPLKHMQDVRVMFGTTSAVAQLRVFGGGAVTAAQDAFAQLRFRTPVVGFAGQRMILRSLSPPETLGGAIVLDPVAVVTGSGDKRRLPVLEAALTRDTAAVALALSAAQGGICDLRDVARLARKTMTGARADLKERFQTVEADMIAARQEVDACRAEMLQALAAYHAAHPLKAMAPRVAIAGLARPPVLLRFVETALVGEGLVRQHGVGLALCDHDPMAQMSAQERHRMIAIEDIFDAAGLTPPSLKSIALTPLDSALCDLLFDADRLVALHNVALKQTVVLHADALHRARETLRRAFPAPQPFTTSQARTALETSRRIIVPVLEHFDSLGITHRQGDIRQMAPANSISPAHPTC